MAAFLTADHADSADGIFRLSGFALVSDFELRISDFPFPCIPRVPWFLSLSLVGATPRWAIRGDPWFPNLAFALCRK